MGSDPDNAVPATGASYQADRAALPGSGIRREWQRFTPGERLARFAVYFCVVAAFVLSLGTVEVIPEFLWDAPAQVQDLLVRMWPPAYAHYPASVHAALVETLHMATLGTVIAMLLAVPLGLLAANNVMPSRTVNTLAKLALVTSRSVNSLVWALLFIAVFGPGALAGTLAIAFRSIGFVGKLLGEALEEAHRGPVEALKASGAPWPSLLVFGYWPQVKPAFWALVLLRWDINVRESAVLGLVGAGGIGVALNTAMNLFQWDRVAVVLLAIFAVVIVAEVVVTWVRGRIL
ncbi:MAG: phosphonate ABC transporter, permease protein PhnE [bacterium]|nr:phosphonate ABC transporter, permease protein PhnE [Rhodocyclaceae bacterium]MCE2980989.1 phosphonate ABC transporter, permease protein PhnE [Betaproteobacteria bacterium]